jgi:hypothetical protein
MRSKTYAYLNSALKAIEFDFMEGLPFWKGNALAQPYDQSFLFISFHLSAFAFAFATCYLVNRT